MKRSNKQQVEEIKSNMFKKMWNKIKNVWYRFDENFGCGGVGRYFFGIPIALAIIISAGMYVIKSREENYRDNINQHVKLVDIVINDESHEYIFIRYDSGASLSHWEGCKYCKEKQDSIKLLNK